MSQPMSENIFFGTITRRRPGKLEFAGIRSVLPSEMIIENGQAKIVGRIAPAARASSYQRRLSGSAWARACSQTQIGLRIKLVPERQKRLQFGFLLLDGRVAWFALVFPVQGEYGNSRPFDAMA